MRESLNTACMQVLDLTDESPREVDTYLTMLIRVAQAEHRRLTVNEDGLSYRSELSRLCQDFIVDCYFGGWHPSADADALRLIAKARTTLSNILCDTVGVKHRGHIYNDELSEIRVQLMARDSVCEKLERKLGGAYGSQLSEYRTRGYVPPSSE